MSRRFTAFAVALSVFLGSSHADTVVSVVEIGKGGVVRHATSTDDEFTTPSGVASFWNTLHNTRPNERQGTKASQHPGMGVVPDLFHMADGGIVVGIVGAAADLSVMPTISKLAGAAVGQFHLSGSQGTALMQKLSSNEIFSDVKAFDNALQQSAKTVSHKGGNSLVSATLEIGENTMEAVDGVIDSLLKSLEKECSEKGSTVVLHVVVENDKEGEARRRLTTRALDDEKNEGELSIFQINYFNVVLWTAVGLFVVLYSAVMMTVNMPLMPDTLLFGESAKMATE